MNFLKSIPPERREEAKSAILAAALVCMALGLLFELMRLESVARMDAILHVPARLGKDGPQREPKTNICPACEGTGCCECGGSGRIFE